MVQLRVPSIKPGRETPLGHADAVADALSPTDMAFQLSGRFPNERKSAETDPPISRHRLARHPTNCRVGRLGLLVAGAACWVIRNGSRWQHLFISIRRMTPSGLVKMTARRCRPVRLEARGPGDGRMLEGLLRPVGRGVPEYRVGAWQTVHSATAAWVVKPSGPRPFCARPTAPTGRDRDIPLAW